MVGMFGFFLGRLGDRAILFWTVFSVREHWVPPKGPLPPSSSFFSNPFLLYNFLTFPHFSSPPRNQDFNRRFSDSPVLTPYVSSSIPCFAASVRQVFNARNCTCASAVPPYFDLPGAPIVAGDTNFSPSSSNIHVFWTFFSPTTGLTLVHQRFPFFFAFSPYLGELLISVQSLF